MVRGILKKALGREALNRDVFAHFVRKIVGMGGWLDAFDVDFGKFFDVRHDVLKLPAKTGDFFFAQIDASEVGDIADIDVGISHGRRMYRRSAGGNRKDRA